MSQYLSGVGASVLMKNSNSSPVGLVGGIQELVPAT